MSGGINGSANTLYYLYSGQNYWTMSPSNFDRWVNAFEAFVASSGELDYGWTSIGFGVRPVVNLDSDNLTFTGNGTVSDPYIIS